MPPGSNRRPRSTDRDNQSPLRTRPLGPARTLVAGTEFDLTDDEADRVSDFITGLIAARGSSP